MSTPGRNAGDAHTGSASRLLYRTAAKRGGPSCFCLLTLNTQMKKRIRDLIAISQQQPVLPSLPADLSERIFEDIQNRRLYTYLEAAEMIGCDPETIRTHAKGFPIIKKAKPHKIPACVLHLIVRTKLIDAA
jgi:hypothetical protein